MAEHKVRKDADIRSDLVAWLLAAHQEDADVRICHEFKVRSRSARADLVLLNGEMAGFEIKSDVDTVARLSKQITAFASVMDKVHVVATQKNIDKVKKIAPDWCGIIIYVAESDENFRVLSEPQPCPIRDDREVAGLLSTAEIYLALKRRGMSRGLSKASAGAALDAFVSLLTQSEQRADILSALKARVDFSEEMKLKYSYSSS
jgi:hypothetical protein